MFIDYETWAASAEKRCGLTEWYPGGNHPKPARQGLYKVLTERGASWCYFGVAQGWGLPCQGIRMALTLSHHTNNTVEIRAWRGLARDPNEPVTGA